jgi:hypothetical protein
LSEWLGFEVSGFVWGEHLFFEVEWGEVAEGAVTAMRVVERTPVRSQQTQLFSGQTQLLPGKTAVHSGPTQSLPAKANSFLTKRNSKAGIACSHFRI